MQCGLMDKAFIMWKKAFKASSKSLQDFLHFTKVVLSRLSFQNYTICRCVCCIGVGREGILGWTAVYSVADPDQPMAGGEDRQVEQRDDDTERWSCAADE